MRQNFVLNDRGIVVHENLNKRDDSICCRNCRLGYTALLGIDNWTRILLTFSIAIDGTSEIKILRIALASDGSAPMMSNSKSI